MLIATWNVNSLNVRMPRVEAWLTEVEPDVVCLQETKLSDSAFPAQAFAQLGYASVHHGEGRWNGVAILSRVGLDDPVGGFDPSIEADPDARLVSARCGGVRVHSVYVPNGREVGHDHYHYKLSWLARLRRHLEVTVSPDDQVIVAGDWNIAPTDADVWDRRAFDGSTHVTRPEREALAGVLDWGLVDTFREHHPDEGLFTYYDYQAGRFHKRQGMRIDYVLS
jgi:exodeoxyribonuclease III